jgi:hypothetical protein
MAMALAAAMLLAFPFSCVGHVGAQTDKARPEITELMGAPVFASDGPEVAEVTAIAAQGDGSIHEIRVTTASPLGLGVRTILLPASRYKMLRGAVILDFSAEEFDALPSVNKPRR